jgi:hypothetical protein
MNIGFAFNPMALVVGIEIKDPVTVYIPADETGPEEVRTQHGFNLFLLCFAVVVRWQRRLEEDR